MMNLTHLLNAQKWSAALERIQTHPEETKTCELFPETLFHYASGRKHIPAYVIEALISAYPQAAKEKSQFDTLPLHVAVRDVSSTIVDVVKVLLHHYPEGATILNAHGHTPLMSHLVICETPTLQVVDMLVKVYPEAVRLVDQYLYYPLHHAMDYDDWDIAKCLIDGYPEVLWKRTAAGETPWDISKRCGFERLCVRLKEEEERIGGEMGGSKDVCVDNVSDEKDTEITGEDTKETGQQDQCDDEMSDEKNIEETVQDIEDTGPKKSVMMM